MCEGQSELMNLLEKRGYGPGARILLESRPPTWCHRPGHPLDELLVPRTDSYGVHLPVRLRRLVWALSRQNLPEGLQRESRLKVAWGEDEGNAHGALSELCTLGLFVEIFPEALLYDWTRNGVPDIEVPNEFHVEVYAPRDSQPERERVDAELSRPRNAESPINVNISISHPITGSSADALRYPANKTALRLLNKKRDTNQGVEGERNVLVVDIQDWDDCSRSASFCTYPGPDHHYIGTYGIWHAFYGTTGRATMLGDRTSNRFVTAREAYQQDPEGFFRVKQKWSAAIIVMRDGLVLFENPWALVPLGEHQIRTLLRMNECRGEYSWFRGNRSIQNLRDRIEEELDRLEWLWGDADEHSS